MRGQGRSTTPNLENRRHAGPSASAPRSLGLTHAPREPSCPPVVEPVDRPVPGSGLPLPSARAACGLWPRRRGGHRLPVWPARDVGTGRTRLPAAGTETGPATGRVGASPPGEGGLDRAPRLFIGGRLPSGFDPPLTAAVAAGLAADRGRLSNAGLRELSPAAAPKAIAILKDARSIDPDYPSVGSAGKTYRYIVISRYHCQGWGVLRRDQAPAPPQPGPWSWSTRSANPSVRRSSRAWRA